jgi:hypothetical protein
MPAFLYAVGGGIALNIIRLAELYGVPKADRPPTFSDPFYWVQFLGVPLVGGFLALVYQRSGSQLSPFLAVNIGASAPAILKSLTSAVPKRPPGNTD